MVALPSAFVRLLHSMTRGKGGSGRRANTKKHRPAFWERFEVLEVTKPVLPDIEPTNTAELWRACPKEEEDRSVCINLLFISIRKLDCH